MFIIGTPHTQGAGYHMNDDRPSGGRLDENDVQSCPHCQAVILMQKWRESTMQNFCTRCMKPTCDNAACIADCVPFIRQFETQFEAIQKYTTYLKMAGLEPASLHTETLRSP